MAQVGIEGAKEIFNGRGSGQGSSGLNVGKQRLGRRTS